MPGAELGDGDCKSINMTSFDPHTIPCTRLQSREQELDTEQPQRWDLLLFQNLICGWWLFPCCQITQKGGELHFCDTLCPCKWLSQLAPFNTYVTSWIPVVHGADTYRWSWLAAMNSSSVTLSRKLSLEHWGALLLFQSRRGPWRPTGRLTFITCCFFNHTREMTARRWEGRVFI